MKCPEKSLKFGAFLLLTFYYCLNFLYFLKKFKIIKKVVDKRFVICYYNLRA